MTRWIAEWAGAFAGAAITFAFIFLAVSCVEQAPKVSECVLISSIETDTYAPYGMVAFRRKFMLNQYRCGEELKTVVE